MKRTLLIVVAVVFAVILVVAIAVPLLVNAERLRPTIEARLSEALARPVHIGRLSFSWLAGGIEAQDVTIADDPAFGPQPFVRAQRLEVGVALWPLIASRQVQIKSLALRAPELLLAQSPAGVWNFASLGGTRKPAQATSGTSEPAVPLSIEKLKIEDGVIVLRRGMVQTYRDLSIQATGVTRDAAFPFSVTAKTPGGGKLKIDGTAGPMPADASQTPFQANLKIEHIDAASSGFFGPHATIAGTGNGNITAKSDGRTIRAEEEGSIEKLRLAKDGAPAKAPVTFKFTSEYDIRAQGGRTSGEVKFGKGVVNVAGSFDAHGPSPVVNVKLNTQALPIADIDNLLPALGVTLPGGASLQGGSATATLTAEGPVDRMVIAGPVHLQDVTLANFDLGQRVQTVAALAGIKTGRDTLIQSLDARLRMTPEATALDDINAAIAGFGNLTGAGTLAGNHALSVNLVAHLSGRGGVLGGIVQAAGVGQLSTVPFRIEGTTDNPKFIPNVGAILQTKQQSGPAQQKNPLGGILGGIFGKKK